MKRTIDMAFSPPNNNNGAPDDDTDNAPAPQRVAPMMRVATATPDPMGTVGPSQGTALQVLGPTSQPLVVARGPATESQQVSESTQEKSMQDADVNLVNQYGQTRLMLAARDGDLPTVKALLSNDANVNVTDKNGWTALMFANEKGHLTTVQTLLQETWADVHAKNNNGATALHLAASEGKVDAIRALIFWGANVNVADNDGWTPLMYASRNNHLTTVQALLGAHGIDIDVQKNDGATALYLAAFNGNHDVVKALINKGAKVNIADTQGRTPLIPATSNGHLMTVQALLSAPGINIDTLNYGMTALHIAAKYSKDEVVKALINKGAKVNIADNEGWTPLMSATRNGHLRTVQALLSAPGIDIDTRNYGRTALHIAVNLGKDEVVKALIDKGADVNIADNDGWTPLMPATSNGHLRTVQALLSAPAININAKKPDGKTALHVAANHGKDNVVKALIDNGANVNVADMFGWTPLMYATSNGHLTAVQALLGTSGVNINAQIYNAENALYLAAFNGNYDVVKALLDHGADINETVEKLKAELLNLDDDSDESSVADIQVLMDYLAQRQADVGNLTEEATWASAFATLAIPPKASQTVIPSLQALEFDTLLQQAQVEVPSLLQISFKAARDQLLQQILSARQVGDLIRLLHSSPFASALVQTLAVAIKLGGYPTKSDQDFIYEKLNAFGLLDACKKNQSRLDSGNINRWQISGQTLLTRAAQAGDLLLVEALTKCGAIIYLPDQHGNNALHAAVKAGQWSVCGHLLALGANPNTSDRSGVSTLAYLAQAFAKGDEQTADIVATLLAPLLAKGHRLDHFVNDPDDLEEVTTILDILRSDLSRYALYAHLLHADGVNYVDDNGLTVLMLATMSGDLTTVQALLGAPDIDIDAQDASGETALIIAIRIREDDIVKALINKGANVNVRTNDGETLLISAAKKGDLTTVEALLSASGIDIEAKNSDGVTALIVAAANGKDDVLKALIKKGANVNVRTSETWTPLMLASEKGHLTTVEALLGTSGIDIEAKKSDGVTALIVAVANGKDDVLKALIKKGANVNVRTSETWTPLMLASEKGDLTTVEALLGATGIDIDAQNISGVTALIIAVANDKDDVVKALIKKGANTNIILNDGYIALMGAAQRGHLTTVQALLSAPDIDIDAQNIGGATALYIAVANDKDDVVKALIKKGANVNVGTSETWTPLMLASEKGHLTTVEALLGASGIDVEAKKSDGATALIVAAANGKDDVVKALIDKGANINVAENGGWTPLMFAVQEGHLTTVQTLLDKHADINRTNEDGMTVFDIIKIKDSNEVNIALLALMQKYRT